MIRQIFHLADIHIRRGNIHESRFSEYDMVIDETVRNISDIHVPRQCICVICGDIFHHKLQISSHGIVLFNKLVTLVSNMMPLIIIQGNHDLIQENDDRNNDLIRAMIENIDRQNVHYYEQSGSYTWDDRINFGMVSIRDMLKANVGSGLVDELPPFPKPDPTRLNIALSHASIHGFKLNNNKTTSHGVPLEWFSGYQLLLLGDIHLQSAKYNKTNELYYGYPGSLVQQDYGEPIFNHGFLVWNIAENNTIESVVKHHVYNRFARGNLRLINKRVHINVSGDYVPLVEFLAYDKLPKTIYLRLWTTDSFETNTIRTNTINLFKERDIVAMINVTHCPEDITQHIDSNEDPLEINYDTINSVETLVEFFRSNVESDSILSVSNHWERFLHHVDNVKLVDPIFENAPKQLRDKIDKKNEKLSAKIEASKRDVGSGGGCGSNVLRIERIEFDWILAFGEKNRFVFTDNSLTLINANNGFGKSAFFECIVLGLFGAPIPSRLNRATTLSILNKRRPSNHVSNITIHFRINNIPYKIKRDFGEYSDTRNKSVSRLHSNSVELYEDSKLIKSGTKLVNAWVEANLCTLKDFLLSTMITQNFDNDFFKLRDVEQKELLDSVLNMNSINGIYDVFKEAKKEYRDLKSHIETFIEAIKPEHEFDESSYVDLQNTIADLEQRLSEKQDMFDAICIPLPKAIRVRDDITKPTESLEEVLEKETTLSKQLDRLDIKPGQYESTPHELHDIDDEHLENGEFLLEVAERHSVQLGRVETDADRQLPSHVQSTLKDLIVRVREANDKLEYAEYTLENVRSSKPNTSVLHQFDSTEEAEAQCEAFEKEFSKLKKQYKRLKNQAVVDEPDFNSSDLVFPEVPEHLLSLEDKELEEIAQKQVVTSSDNAEYAYNTHCWACRKNFDSSESVQARELLDYRRRRMHYNNWCEYLQNKEVIDRYLEMNDALPRWNIVATAVNDEKRWVDKNEYATTNVRRNVYELALRTRVCAKVFDYQTRCNQAHEIAKALANVRSKKDYYTNEKLRLRYTIDSMNTSLIDHKAKLVRLDILRQQEIEYNKQKAGLQEMLDIVGERLVLFTYFSDTLVKYKAWIYNEKLLPAIVKKTNIIVNNMFHDRQLVLQFKYIDNNVVFVVIDEGNSIHMEKLSGAQAFAISLSFRLALSAVGITRFRCNQLFIDEGFCSFDQNNLLNVPVLMKNLTSLFSEILIVTHLNEIKGCADKVVNIVREDGVSTLWCD